MTYILFVGLAVILTTITVKLTDTESDEISQLRGRAREIEHLVRGREYRLWLE